MSMVFPMSSNGKWTTGDIPDQRGRVAIVTGANTGLGYHTAAALAQAGAHVVLAVRDPEKGNLALARIVAACPEADVTLQELDLTSLASVRAAAASVPVRASDRKTRMSSQFIAGKPRPATLQTVFAFRRPCLRDCIGR